MVVVIDHVAIVVVGIIIIMIGIINVALLVVKLHAVVEELWGMITLHSRVLNRLVTVKRRMDLLLQFI